LILLIANPTWIKTQSPGTGGSSCKSPKSTLRRTPTTSTTACCGFCESISTIFPGIARHTIELLLPRFSSSEALLFASFLYSRHEVKIEHELVLQPQCPTSERNRFDPVIRLPQRELSGHAQYRSQIHDSRVQG